MKFFLFFTAALLASLSALADSYDPTDDLMAAFGNQCSSAGGIANTALAQSGALKGVIESLKKDPTCQSIIPLANNIDQDLSARLSNATDANRLSQQVDELQAAIQAEQAKGASADQNYIAGLQQERVTEEVALLKAKQTVSPNVGTKPSEAAGNFYNHATALLDGIAANSECVGKHPNVLAQVGAQILKLSSDYVSGAAGSILLATGGVIDHFVQFVRNYQINGDIKGIMTARLGHALGCSLEGLGSTYCSARDIQYLVDASRDNQVDVSCSTIAQGTNLLSRDLLAFQNFVTAIYAGSTASSTATAAEKIQVNSLRGALGNLSISVDGTTNTAAKNIINGNDNSGVILGLMSSLSSSILTNINKASVTVNGGTYPAQNGPIGDFFVSDTTCGPYTFYYTQGVQKSCAVNSNDAATANPCASCVVRNNPGIQLPTLDNIRAQSKQILAAGQQYVDQQLALYNQNDPQLALTASETYGPNQKRAIDFLLDARAYLQHLMAEKSADPQVNQMAKTIQQALDSINAVIATLQASSDPSVTPIATTKALMDELAPSADVDYIPNELTTIVRFDIDNQLAHGKIDKNLAMVLELSNSDSISELLNSYSSLEATRNQVRSAKKLTKANLDAVGGVFGKNIASIMKQLRADSSNDADSADDLALLCVQSLIVPSAPKLAGNDITEYCKGTKYKSAYDSLAPLEFDALSKAPYEQRACSVYEFYRKSRLIEKKYNNH